MVRSIPRALLALFLVASLGACSNFSQFTQGFAGAGAQRAGVLSNGSSSANSLRGVQSAGAAYVDALKKVNSHALNNSLEFTADLLPNMPRNQATLAEHTQDMKARMELLTRTQAYLETLNEYFTALDVVAKGQDGEAAVKSLTKAADSLRALPAGLKPTEATTKVAGQMGGLLLKGHYSNAVESALERDAEAVGVALALTEQVLDEQIRWIALRENLVRKVEYFEGVEKPFIEGKRLGDTWKKAWMNDIKAPATIAVLEQAKVASKRMQGVWANVLRGVEDYSGLNTALMQLEVDLKTARAVRGG